MAAIGLILVISHGIAPVFPALAGVIRALLHPFVLIGLVAFYFLLRVRLAARSRE